MIEHRACPACGDSTDKSREIRRTSVHNRGEPALPIRIVECGCGHVFLNPMPTLEELAPFYQSDYHVFAAQPADAAQTLARKRQGDRLDHALIVPGGKYLDLGCGLREMVAYNLSCRGSNVCVSYSFSTETTEMRTVDSKPAALRPFVTSATA